LVPAPASSSISASLNVVRSPTQGNDGAETALVGWGARIRTWEWRNQNPLQVHGRVLIASNVLASSCHSLANRLAATM